MTFCYAVVCLLMYTGLSTKLHLFSCTEGGLILATFPWSGALMMLCLKRGYLFFVCYSCKLEHSYVVQGDYLGVCLLQLSSPYSLNAYSAHSRLEVNAATCPHLDTQGYVHNAFQVDCNDVRSIPQHLVLHRHAQERGEPGGAFPQGSHHNGPHPAATRQQRHHLVQMAEGRVAPIELVLPVPCS